MCVYIYIIYIYLYRVGKCRKSLVQNYIVDLKSNDNFPLSSIYRIQEQKVSSCTVNNLSSQRQEHYSVS